MDENHQWLFAVNAGDNSISAFQINGDGSLMLINTISSGGEMPVSIDVWGNYLYVVNFLSSNINGYMIGSDGMLTEIAGTNHSLSTANAQPAQIMFHPSGNVLYVTEKHTNRITDFLIDDMGVASAMDWRHANALTPFGFEFARERFMIVSNAEKGLPNQSSVSSYRTTETGKVNDNDNDAVGTEQTAACWVAVTERGRYAYVTNTGSNSISSYYIDINGKLHLIESIAATTGLAPLDITLLGNYYVYNINSEAHTIGGYNRESGGALSFIADVIDVPAYAAGLIGF
jgi:6-phosphogluconolactonase (cycloisomerase 2 family)